MIQQVKLAVTTIGAGANIVLLHGWLAHSQLWQQWAAQTFAGYRITLIDLPGHGNSPAVELSPQEQIADAWQEAILAVMPEQAIVIGWSLGGLMAQRIALTHPERVTQVIMLASSPCFVQRSDWMDGLDITHFTRYLNDLEHDPEGLFKSFLMLQSLGSPKPKHLFKQLALILLPVTADHQALAQGLALLGELDFRSSLAQLTVPTVWILAEQDAIVPITLAQQLTQLQPNAHIKIVHDCGHLPFLTQPTQTQADIQSVLITTDTEEIALD